MDFFFFFPIQQSVHCCSMDTRGQSECREHRRLLQQGANLLGSVIRRPFTQQGPEWMRHFSEGIRNFYKNTSRSGGGQSGFQYLFIFVHKDDRIRMNKNCCSIWFKKGLIRARVSDQVLVNESHEFLISPTSNLQTINTTWAVRETNTTTHTHSHKSVTFEEWGKTSKIPEQLTNHSPAGRCDRVHTSLVDRLASVMLSVGRDLN